MDEMDIIVTIFKPDLCPWLIEKEKSVCDLYNCGNARGEFFCDGNLDNRPEWCKIDVISKRNIPSKLVKYIKGWIK